MKIARSPTLWLFLAALAVRLAFVSVEPPARRVGDEGIWRAMGRELASPEVGFSPLRSQLISHPPLYPYLIAGTVTAFGSILALKWAQALLGALLVPAVAAIGTRWFDRRVGLIAAAWAAFDPVLVWHCGHLWSEVLFLALLWWAFERLIVADARESAGAALVAGLFFGLAILTRETVFYFAPLVALWLAWRRPPGLRRGAAFLLGCAIVVGPWAWRNQQVFGFALPLATRGTLNLWKGNAELPWPEVHRRYGLVAGELEKHRLASREALREILSRQPGWVLYKTAREIPALWGVNNLVIIHLQNEAYGPLPRAVVWLVGVGTILPHVVLLALAVWGLSVVRADRISALLVGFLVCYTALHVVAFGFPRFRLPAMPVVFLLAAAGWRQLRHGPRPSPRRRLLAVALGLALGAAVVQSLLETLQHPLFGLGVRS